METFKKMLGMEAKPSKAMLKTHSTLDYDISGLIGLSGKVIGSVAMCFPEASAIAICNKFMTAEYENLHEDILDAVGEFKDQIRTERKIP